MHGNREGVLFRCDVIDGNCHQDGLSRPIIEDRTKRLTHLQAGAAIGVERTPRSKRSSARSLTLHVNLSKLFVDLVTLLLMASSTITLPQTFSIVFTMLQPLVKVLLNIMPIRTRNA